MEPPVLPRVQNSTYHLDHFSGQLPRCYLIHPFTGEDAALKKKCSKTLYIPLEIFSREWASKLLISANLAPHGISTIIGHKSSVLRLAQRANTPGIWFNKSAEGTGHEYMRDLKTKGFKLVAQDEEAGVIYDNFSTFFEKRLSLANAWKLDSYFCWGPDDYDFLTQENKSHNNSPFKLTGSPRSAMWGVLSDNFYKDEIVTIKQRYGRYVLMATNFGAANSYLARDQLSAFLAQFPGFDSNYLSRLISTEKNLVHLFVEAAKAISGKLNINVVLRPHPSENVAFWEKIFENEKKIFVREDLDISPWIRAAIGVVQNGCTSSLEAAAGGIPVIALGADMSEIFHVENPVPNRVAIPVVNFSDLLDIFTDLLHRGNPTYDSESADRKELINRKLIGAGSRAPIDNISRVIKDLTKELGTSDDLNPTRMRLSNNELVYETCELLRMSKFRLPRRQAILDQSKRPPLRPEKAGTDLASAARTLNIEQPVTLQRVGISCFEIFSAQQS